MQRLKVGDLVQVISGDEKGKTGTITKIMRDEDRAIVEGLKLVTKHQKPNARNQQGGKITMEAPIHVSNLMPVDPDTKRPTRVRVQVKDDKKIRVAKSGATLESGK